MSTAMPTLLVIEDDAGIRDLLIAALGERFVVVFAADAGGALHQLGAEQPDLVLLDLGLADMDGLLLLGKIRQTSRVPIIVVSGRATQADRVLSLKCGGDDFIAKPFDLDLLDARIDAVLRRSRRQIAEPAEPGELRFGTLSLSAKRGARVDGAILPLAPTPFRLLEILLEHQSETLSHERLSTLMWGVDDVQTHTLDVHVMRLRAVLRAVPGAPEIVTERGKGFRLQAGR